MAQVIRYVDPDAGGGGTGVDWANAYTSLSACEAAERTDLVSAGNYLTINCRSSSGTADTTAVTFANANWTTDTTHYIEIIGTDFPSNGVLDTSKYNLALTNSTILTIGENVRLINLQVVVTTTTGTVYGIYYTGGDNNNEFYIDSCIIKGVCSGTGTTYGIYINDTAFTTYLYNTVVYDFVSGADVQHEGYRLYGGTAVAYVYNCTFYNCRTGMINVAGTTNAKNVISGNNTDDFWAFGGIFNIDHCCSDDGDGTNAQNPSGGSWANEFVNPGTDFDLLSGGNCVGNGTDNPGSGLYSDDIIGTARSSTWDIGAFEYAAAPPAGGFPIMYQFNF